MKISIHEDPEICQRLWEDNWPVNNIFDLWPVRYCFHRHYNRPIKFYTAEQSNKITGMLPLSWNEKTDSYIHFPGETWHGKTWLEQNQIIAEDTHTLTELLEAVPGRIYLRYLTGDPLFADSGLSAVDEIGYLFYPGMFDYSMDAYWLCFSGKHRKNLKNDLKKLEQQRMTFRFNNIDDIDHLFRLNLEVFSEQSYFLDSRFYQSFKCLALYLKKMGMLRITTIVIGEKVAAVDMGAVFKNTYTLLAGGTNPEFPGIAKLINLHHLEWSCKNKIDTVDFLCGDFNWKQRFHLIPRPLYDIKYDKKISAYSEMKNEKEKICA